MARRAAKLQFIQFKLFELLGRPFQPVSDPASTAVRRGRVESNSDAWWGRGNAPRRVDDPRQDASERSRMNWDPCVGGYALGKNRMASLDCSKYLGCAIRRDSIDVVVGMVRS